MTRSVVTVHTLANQISPFEVMSPTNPAMQKFRVEFKTLGGGTLRTDDRR